MKERTAAEGHGALAAWLPAIVAILATVVLPRLLMLNVSVIDWDESIYALIGQQWIQGHVPHETVFDHKPIGLYAIFASFFLVFGDAVWAIRLIPIAFVAGTAALLARLAQAQFGDDRMLGGVVAALYGLLTLTNGGLATNTEILINFFVVLSLYLIVRWQLDCRTSIPGGLAAGASLGMALQVNYLAGILVAGAAGYYLAWAVLRRPATGFFRRYLQNGAYMFCGFLLFTIIAHLPVLLYGDLSDYFALKLAYLSGYEGVGDTAIAVRRVSEAISPYWPFLTLALLLAATGLWGRGGSQPLWDTRESPADRSTAAWLVFAAFAVAAALASQHFYQHFFLFLVPALVMLAAAFLRLARPAGRLRAFIASWLVLMGAVSALDAREELLRGYRAQQRVLRGAPADSVAEAGDFMARRLEPGDTIYVHDGQPILYFMTRTVPPTRFAFPDTHLKDEVANRLGFTPSEAVGAILERKPRFIVTRPRPDGSDLSPAAARLYDALDRDYAPARAAEPAAPAYIYVRTVARGAIAG
jgi:4-amino-4-deoxy-L-arabinose transferase-like glycosyltransferase